MTRYGACAVPISLSKWPMQIIFAIYWSYDQPTLPETSTYRSRDTAHA